MPCRGLNLYTSKKSQLAPQPQVRQVFRSVDDGLVLDPQLCGQLDAQALAEGRPLRPELAAAAEAGEGGNPAEPEALPAAQQVGGQRAVESLEETAEDMLPLAERLGACVELMYVQWRDAVNSAARSRAAACQATDDLLAEREVWVISMQRWCMLCVWLPAVWCLLDVGSDFWHAPPTHHSLTRSTGAPQTRLCAEERADHLQATFDRLAAELSALQADDVALRVKLAQALSEADTSRLDRQAAECERDHAAGKVEVLDKRVAALWEELGRAKAAAVAAAQEAVGVRERLEAAGRKLLWRQRLMAEVGAIVWGRVHVFWVGGQMLDGDYERKQIEHSSSLQNQRANLKTERQGVLDSHPRAVGQPDGPPRAAAQDR
jgi:hypothetical protein